MWLITANRTYMLFLAAKILTVTKVREDVGKYVILTSRKMLQVGSEVNFMNFDTLLNEDSDSMFLIMCDIL
jgi:hypothetical protein